MKNYIILLLLFTFTQSFSQTAKYGNLTENGKYKSYITKNNDTLNIGDKLIIGLPFTADRFTYITQGNIGVAPKLAQKEVSIHKFQSYGTNGAGYNMYVLFKGYGMAPVYIDYEIALELGEVINPNGLITRDQAIFELSEAKQLLDLEVISKEEYDKLKAKLTPIILDKS